MFDFKFSSDVPKSKFYEELHEQVKALISSQRNYVTNLANVAALLYHGLNSLKVFQTKPVNWAGFYLASKEEPGILHLGPFQGKVACTEIRIGRGVCGTAAAENATQLVADVHQFPGHIACDSDTNSEIVVPIFWPESSKVVAVMDIDSLGLNAFTAEDKCGLEKIATTLVLGCDWP